MPLQPLISLRPRSATVAGVHTSLLQFIAVQESNNNYLETLQSMVSGATAVDEGKSLIINSSGSVVLTDDRTRVRVQDVLLVSPAYTDSGTTARSITLGSTGAATLNIMGKVDGLDQYQVQMSGDTGTSAVFSVSDATHIVLDAVSVSILGSSGTWITNPIMEGLVYPTSDGIAGDAIVTDGSGALSFDAVKQFTRASGTDSYTYSYTPITGSLSVAPDLSPSSSSGDGIPTSAYGIVGGTSGFGAYVDSGVAGHAVFVQFNRELMLTATLETGGVYALQLGNDASISSADYVYVKPSMADSTSFPSITSDMQGGVFYDPTLHTLHYVGDSSLKEIATTDDIAGKLTLDGGGIVTGILSVEPSMSTDTRPATDPDLKFVDADGSGFYAKASVLLGAGDYAVSYYYPGSVGDIFEFWEEGIIGSDALLTYTPRLNYSSGGNLPATPSYTFTGDATTGVYLSVAGTLSFASSGVNMASVTSTEWNFNGKKITNLPTPIASSEASTKGYVDGVLDAGSASNSILKYNSSNSKWEEESSITIPAVGTVLLGESGVDGSLQIFESAGYYTQLKSGGPLASNITFTLPYTTGSADYLLKTNGSGLLSFVSLNSLGDSRYVQPGSADFTASINLINGSALAPSITFNSTRAGFRYDDTIDSSSESSSTENYRSSGIVFQNDDMDNVVTIGEHKGTNNNVWLGIFGDTGEAPLIITEPRVGPVYTFRDHDETGIGFDYVYAADMDTSSSGSSEDTFSDQDALIFYVGDASVPVAMLLDDRLEMMYGVKVTGLPAPTDASDAVNKVYLDTQISGIIAPGTSGSVAGELLTYRTSSQTPEFDSKATILSNTLTLGTTSDTDEGKISLSTTYSHVSIQAPTATTTSSGAGYVTPYTLTLPSELGSTNEVLVSTDATGTLEFQRRGAYGVTQRFVLDIDMSAAYAAGRYGMTLTIGSAPFISPPSPITGFVPTVTATGETDIVVGSSSSSFKAHTEFSVKLNGMDQIRGDTVSWVSATSFTLNCRLKNYDIVEVTGVYSDDQTTLGY